MKYKVIIPPPKAKRMNEHKKVVVEYSGGFDGYYYQKIHLLKPHEYTFEFEISKGIDYIYDSSTMDGDYFNVYVEYSNESRSERIYLVPGKV
jgi:hypothetical protein